MPVPGSHALCLECGLCCNGVIFARGQLQPGDDAGRLASLGLDLISGRKDRRPDPKFRQPCAVLDGCRCRIYRDRPRYCREFECRLLQSLQAGAMKPAAAARVIRTALRRVAKVERFLAGLGDADRTVPLGLRFQRVRRKLERCTADPGQMASFGELTLAMHDLNLLLSAKFYPG